MATRPRPFPGTSQRVAPRTTKSELPICLPNNLSIKSVFGGLCIVHCTSLFTSVYKIHPCDILVAMGRIQYDIILILIPLNEILVIDSILSSLLTPRWRLNVCPPSHQENWNSTKTGGSVKLFLAPFRLFQLFLPPRIGTFPSRQLLPT